jgi:hypothetical protein
MLRSACCWLVLLVAPWSSSLAAAEPRVAPLYALPADGTWVEYQWKAQGPDGSALTGTLRISSVGRKEINGGAHRWVEITRDWKEDGKARSRSRKLLVSEKALPDGWHWRESVQTVFAMEGRDGVVTQLSPKRTGEFLGMGFDATDVALKEVRPEEKVETALGKFVTRHVTARTDDERRTLEYHGWLTTEVPYGWAKCEVHERVGAGRPRLVFSAAAVRSGRDARSVVDETKVKN